MDRASDSGSESWGFESLRACHKKVLKSCDFNTFLVFEWLFVVKVRKPRFGAKRETAQKTAQKLTTFVCEC